MTIPKPTPAWYVRTIAFALVLFAIGAIIRDRGDPWLLGSMVNGGGWMALGVVWYRWSLEL